MEITRTSIITGTTRTKDLNVTPEQIKAWEGGKLIQDAMPQLTADEREFILTGVTQDEWDKYIKDDEEDT